MLGAVSEKGSYEQQATLFVALSVSTASGCRYLDAIRHPETPIPSVFEATIVDSQLQSLADITRVQLPAAGEYETVAEIKEQARRREQAGSVMEDL